MTFGPVGHRRAASGWLSGCVASLCVCAALLLAGGPVEARNDPRIGRAEKVVQDVRALMPEMERRLVVNEDVFRNDTIETKHASAARLVFRDETYLSIGPASRVRLANLPVAQDDGKPFVVDVIMAFWNAPVDDPRHADHACRAALAMVAALQALNKEMAAEAAGAEAHHAEAPVVLRAGIGLNSGRCLAGNLGTHKRFNYSVLGDPVNVAARLEALSRTYDVDIILGEATVSALDGRYALLELDLIQVKGRQRPARIFALLGDAALADDPAFTAFAAAHAAMIAAAHGDDPATATRLIAQQRQTAGRFGMAAVYALYADRLAGASTGPARQRA